MSTHAKPGFFVTFEGIDGSGKSTQLRKLAQYLETRGEPVTATRQPGGTPIGDRIRGLVLNSSTEHLAAMTELGLMFSDRAQCIAEVIRPALENGRIVLCDRFTDSTEAYQGGGRELGSQVVLQMHQQMCGGLNPDLTILIVPDFHRSISRARRRNNNGTSEDEGRFENEADLFLWRVYEKYVDIAARDSERVVSIPGNLSIEAIHEIIVQIVDNRLTDHRSRFQGSCRPVSH